VGVNMPEVHALLQQPQQDEPGATVHAGVQCEGCGIDGITGCAFLCANCPQNYSLCQACHDQKRSLHLSTHLFVRVPRHLPPLYSRRAHDLSGTELPLLPLLFPQLTLDVFVN
jgi:hypothetical protein